MIKPACFLKLFNALLVCLTLIVYSSERLDFLSGLILSVPKIGYWFKYSYSWSQIFKNYASETKKSLFNTCLMTAALQILAACYSTDLPYKNSNICMNTRSIISSLQMSANPNSLTRFCSSIISSLGNACMMIYNVSSTPFLMYLCLSSSLATVLRLLSS